MNYQSFANALKPFPCFSIREIGKYFPGFDRRRLVEWQAKGYLEKLRNGHYCFREQPDNEYFRRFIANQLYRPSYISLESALAWYGVIPEAVFQTLSVTTRKSQRFETTRGVFVYRSLKREFFFGYRFATWQQFKIAIAEPEKALIDYLYLHPDIRNSDDLATLRWNVFTLQTQINPQILLRYENQIASPALSKRLQLLKDLLDADSRSN